ncbi:MAG: type II toxin-antitoxin system HicA family toxin [Bryobacteraceae bacterium]
MAVLPSLSGERAVRAFQKAGWIRDRQHGSHVILVKPGNPASLSYPCTANWRRVRYAP